MNTYPHYKNTDQAWLTSVPTHWDMIKIKYLFEERCEKGFPNEPLLVASQNKGVILKKSYANRTVEAQKDLHLLKLVCEGDFVISLRSFQGGIEYAHCKGIISPAYTIMVPKNKIHSGYFRYLAKSPLFIKLLQTCVTGIREGQNIDYLKLKNYRIPVPELQEQEQIARYLDWYISKINAFINAKKREINLLEEKKQYIIYNYTNYGNAEQDTGVSWKKDKITRLFKTIGSGTTPSSGNKSFYENGVFPWLNSGDLYSNAKYLRNIEKKITQHAIDSCSALKLYSNNSIVIAMYGASIGNTSIVQIPFYCNQACCVLSNPSDLINMEFAYYAILANKRKLIEEAKGGGQPNISQDLIKRLWLPLPALSEQIAIVEKLDAILSQIDSVIKGINEQIELFNELRSKIISDVVTGQVDIRKIRIKECSNDSRNENSGDIETDTSEVI